MTSFGHRVLLTLSALGTVVACTGHVTNQSSENPSTQKSTDIFSNRPIGSVDDLFVFTLNSPALLEAAIQTPQGLSFPQDAKNKIASDQAEFEARLKAVAPSAKIVYRYHMVLNGLAIYAPSDVAEKLSHLPQVKSVAPAHLMARPMAVHTQAPPLLGKSNSVEHIGATAANRLGFTGRGMRVGVIDTGIDYTHAMLGGSGDPKAYLNIDPNLPNAAFPNARVVGGTDLVGSDFDAASLAADAHLPRPDANPIDEAGHGTHVAGTIAGHGNGVDTYDGVAPDAQLYAIKVFGKKGSTADAVVAAALEYAVDPNGDLDSKDHLDVVNLSLGGDLGQPQVLYSEVVRNVTRAGTVVVASAGNSGAVDYIVGDPSTVSDALSVAASIDDSEINWRFPTMRVTRANVPEEFVAEIEGPISHPIAKADGIAGELVDIGFADQELSDAVKIQLKGKVALIMRGKVSFVEKLTRAQAAGAIGAVVYNNDSTDAFAMGGEGYIDIPAVMISQVKGLELVEQSKAGPVVVQFKTAHFVEKPELIDTITSFSSKGPRSEDNLFKPEISAPGQNVTSALMGSGSSGVLMDGTSMASPHMTGAMVLIKQAHPNLSVAELKAVAMNTAKVLGTANAPIPMTLQGAGLVQIVEAVQTQFVSDTASISLGRIELEKAKTETRKIILRNLTDKEVTLSVATESANAELTLTAPAQVIVPAHGKAPVLVTLQYQLLSPLEYVMELDGRLVFKNGANVVLQIPAMAMRIQASHVVAHEVAAAGVSGRASGNFTFTNTSPVVGYAVAFNLLGVDAKKLQPPADQRWKGRSCDLRSVGYRILRSGDKLKIQFGFDLYTPLTTWDLCSLSVLIDADGDGIADQEIAGVTGVPLEGFAQNFVSVLLDAPKARSLRLDFEHRMAAGEKDAKVDYTPAIESIAPMAPFNQSGFATIEASITPLLLASDGKLHIKVAAQSENGQTFESDDYLGEGIGSWQAISPKLEDQPFYNIPELISIPGAGATMSVTPGPIPGKLVIYYPLNDFPPKQIF